jgi:site-specific recombinase XerD
MAKKGIFKNKTNDKIVKEFIDHIKLGKPILRQKKKPVFDKTAYKYKNWLIKISEWLNNKNFNEITEKDIDLFRSNLKADKIRNNKGKPYSNSTKRDIEYKIIGMFFKWLGKPELAYYTDRYNEVKEIPALSRNEVEKLINASKLRDKVILAVLFDGGFRASEFLNINFNDIKDDERKAKGYYKIRITKSKTKARTIGLYMELTTEILDSWLETNKDKIGTNNKLVDISYIHLGITLKRIGEKILKKKLYPHLLRHSSATEYCHKLNQYQLCKRYGWSMSSNMPALYIDREGVGEEEVGEKIKEEQALLYRKEVNKLKEEMTIVNENNKQMEAELKRREKDLDDFKESIRKEFKETYKNKVMEKIRGKSK